MDLQNSDYIEIAGPATPVAHPIFVGQAVQLPLSSAPSQEWKSEFGSWGELGRYFARMQIEGQTMILYLGTRGRPAIEDALDAVERAIKAANTSRRALVQEDEQQQEQAVRQADESRKKLEDALARWNRRTLGEGG